MESIKEIIESVESRKDERVKGLKYDIHFSADESSEKYKRWYMVFIRIQLSAVNRRVFNSAKSDLREALIASRKKYFDFLDA